MVEIGRVGLTYSLGNSPSANEQSKDVLPHAPGGAEVVNHRDELEGLGGGEKIWLPSPTMTSFLRI